METPQESPKTEAKPKVTATELDTASPVTKPSKKARFGNFCLDFLLVAMTASLIGGSAWYLNKQLKAYHIPTALELAMAENAKLAKIQHDMEEEAFRSDKSARLKLRFKNLQDQLTQLDQEIGKKKAALDAAKGKILASQHQIRQADRDARNLARNQLLPGMMVGVLRTKNGQVYNGAIIRGIDGKKIIVRHDSGQARFNISLLETDSLPALVRYALGLDELVDTSDFEQGQEPEEKPKSKRNKKDKSPNTAQNRGRIVTQSYANYDPKSGVPVLDSSRQTKTSNTADAPAASNIDAWDAPDAPLPL